MASAIAPTELPGLPENAIGWARSTKRAGGMYHAHSLGFPVCSSKIVLDRLASEGMNSLGDAQYWGVCPKCYRLAIKSQAEAA